MAVDVIVAELNKLYTTDKVKYDKEVNDFKALGYKIYRNDEGQHKVIEPERKKKSLFGNEAMDSLFGGIFGGI